MEYFTSNGEQVHSIMIRAILVDDEQLSLHHLKNKLLEIGKIEVIKTFSNGTDVLKEMKNLNFNVAFLDIEMPGLNGLDLAEIIRGWDRQIQIVFVTAYRDYAIQAFELHSIDYLLKPIMVERLEKTVFRLQEHFLTHEREHRVKTLNSNSLKVICFSEFIVYHHNRPVKWKTLKVKELFAYFITYFNTHMHRDTIIEALWPDTDYQRAKIQLHTAISYLRKTLDSMGYLNAITFSNECYLLYLADLQCDAHQFETLIEQHSKMSEEHVELFEEIIQYYSGDYLENNGYEWALVKAQSIRQQLLHLLQKMIVYFSDKGILNKKQHYLQLLVFYNPYSEYAIQQLMKFYIDNGNRGEAVKIYHEMKDRLLDELGILPDPSTTLLFESILQ